MRCTLVLLFFHWFPISNLRSTISWVHIDMHQSLVQKIYKNWFLISLYYSSNIFFLIFIIIERKYYLVLWCIISLSEVRFVSFFLHNRKGTFNHKIPITIYKQIVTKTLSTVWYLPSENAKFTCRKSSLEKCWMRTHH